MKRILYFLLAFVLCMLLPLSVSATGDTKDTAEEIITYEGLQARLALDSPGIRSLYTVDQKAVTALEEKGYSRRFVERSRKIHSRRDTLL